MVPFTNKETVVMTTKTESRQDSRPKLRKDFRNGKEVKHDG
jgi:hypothetical protein